VLSRYGRCGATARVTAWLKFELFEKTKSMSARTGRFVWLTYFRHADIHIELVVCLLCISFSQYEVTLSNFTVTWHGHVTDIHSIDSHSVRSSISLAQLWVALVC
jgi:fatty acid desaturase